MAKIMTWELESAKGVTAYDASNKNTSLSHANWDNEKTIN